MLTGLSDDTPPLLQYRESADLPGGIAASAVHTERLPELPGSLGKTTRSDSPSDGGADVNVTPGASGAIPLPLHERMGPDTLTYLDQALADLEEDESYNDYTVVGPVGMVPWTTILGGKTAEDDKRTKILLENTSDSELERLSGKQALIFIRRQKELERSNLLASPQARWTPIGRHLFHRPSNPGSTRIFPRWQAFCERLP
ncbi:hypothetical protein BD309DRAFT_1024775 [Dichomitus squalens]|nr:hypothetical protein BD309DRAFT_1024775 [Dichomitus squalens]